MQVQGGEAKTLTAGQTFYENPDDIHTVANNASDTEPAKILVFFIKDSDAPCQYAGGVGLAAGFIAK